MKKQFLLFFSLIIMSAALLAQTNISGTISNNTTLTASGSPYVVTGHLNVNSGVILTVEAGVEVRFNSGIYIQVYGTLNASGAVFTANGSTTRGFWPGIYVSYENSAYVGQVNLDNCTVEYATSVFVRKGELTLSNNTLINNFSNYGLDIYSAGTVQIENTTIQNCKYPVYFRDISSSGNGNWNVGAGVSLSGNDNDYIYLDFRDVRNEFKLPNLGIPYYYNSELRILEAGTLKAEPGISIQGNTGAYIAVYGKLKAPGTISQPIEFRNDPASAYWLGMNFNDQAIDTACILSNCLFTGAIYSYYNQRATDLGYTALEVIGSSPTFDNCEFSGNRYNLLISGKSSPVFNDCLFGESNYINQQPMNINVDLNASPVFNGCSLEFNASESRAIGIVGSTIFHDAHMKHQSFTGIDSITYSLMGNIIIQDTASLFIDPGMVIKCSNAGYYIQANGSLNAVGSESKPIVFTHINDDNWGRPYDTHGDGTTSIGASTSGRLILNGPAVSHVEHWKILYAGLNSGNYAVYVYNDNILKNCEIRDTHRGIIFAGNAQLLNNVLENSATYPFTRIMNEGTPVMIGNTTLNCGHFGIYVYNFSAGTYSIGGLAFNGTENVAYIIDNNISVPAGADVTIVPGTVFKFSNGSSRMTVSGGLKVEGTRTNKVIFTSLYDNSAAGNTNYNGGADPTGYKWYGIDYYDASNDNFNSLKNCEVRYVRNSLVFTDCKVAMDSVLVNFSDNYGVSVFGAANPVITNCEFNNLAVAPVYMDMFAQPVFSGNSIANVNRIGISIRGGVVSGTVPARSFGGYDTITYLIEQPLRIDDQLTVPAGLTFKGNSNTYFDIYGKLNVLGTESKPVIFTTLQDDAYGKPKDTQMNGSGGIAKNGIRLVFRDQCDDNSIIRHAIFRHSYDYSVYFGSASPKITNTKFFQSNSWGLYLTGTSAPTVDSCIFEDVPFPIITSLMAFPGNYTGNVLKGATARGILIIDNETLTQNFTMTKRDFAGLTNIPYIFDRYYVGTSAVLTIEPGVVCKFRQNGYMDVRNGLIAEGGSSPDSMIVFTSDRDDFYGGDTYGDGVANVANDRWWWGIYFLEESIDASCRLNNVILKNGSRLVSYSAHGSNRGAISMSNASPSIQNCLFERNYWSMLVRNTSLPLVTNCDFVETDPTYGYGIWNETGTVTMVAENCWWNDATGPYNAALNPGGLGERVSSGVDFTPWISQTAKPILGDVSLNGEVMPYDASLVLQHTVGNITLDNKQLAVADVSRNGTVTSLDASLILQYSIGLITNFDQTAKKAAYSEALAEIRVLSDQLDAPGTSFELPVIISTSGSVKSMDITLSITREHMRFVGLNTDEMPQEIMTAWGYNESTGTIQISMASAHDLDLFEDNLGLIFEWQGPGVESSDIELSGLVVDEQQQEGPFFTVSVNSDYSTTGIGASRESLMKLYSVDNEFVAEIYLPSDQAELVVTVYDLTGKITNKMVFEHPLSGQNHFMFRAEYNGELISNKIYIIAIKGDDFLITRKQALK